MLTWTDFQTNVSVAQLPLPSTADPAAPTLEELRAELSYLMRAVEELRDEWRVAMSRERQAAGESMKVCARVLVFGAVFKLSDALLKTTECCLLMLCASSSYSSGAPLEYFLFAFRSRHTHQ